MKDADESRLSCLFIELSFQGIMPLYSSDKDQNNSYFHQPGKLKQFYLTIARFDLFFLPKNFKPRFQYYHFPIYHYYFL